MVKRSPGRHSSPPSLIRIPVKLDLNGRRFFKHVLNQELPWLDIVKPPKVQSLPDIPTPDEIAMIIHFKVGMMYWPASFGRSERYYSAKNISLQKK